MDIKNLIENDYVIVCDTNVLLHIYGYMPEYFDFSLECLELVKDSIMIPSTVSVEFERHYNQEFKKMKNRIKSIKTDSLNHVRGAVKKIHSVCNELKKIEFPDIEEFYDDVLELTDKVEETFKEFIESKEKSITQLENGLISDDLVYQWYKKIKIMPNLSQIELYDLSEQAENRILNNTPPGYKDSNKKGSAMRKYGDFFLWWEILRFSKDNKKNIILVIDDVKPDWFNTDNNGEITLRNELIKEFKKQTNNQELITINSKELYDEISSSYGVQRTDYIDYMLGNMYSDYCDRIAERVFEYIEDELRYSGTSYIDTTSTTLGDMGLDEFDIIDNDCASCRIEEWDDDSLVCMIRYNVTMSGIAFDYWGRDEDTREIITSPHVEYIFEGYIDVRVKCYLDFWDIDFLTFDEYDEAEIESGQFKVIESNSLFEEHGYANICPTCGKELTYQNDAGTGFCIDCERERE